MIRLWLAERTLARTRIAISPLGELVSALYLLHRHPERVAWPYTGWAARAREVLRTVPATAALSVYPALYGPSHARRTPDLFTPIPPAASPTITEELALLRQTPPELVAEQRDGCSSTGYSSDGGLLGGGPGRLRRGGVPPVPTAHQGDQRRHE
jgi:hypothetical protein